MLTATANIMLPTTVIGSLPRPSWFTENMGSQTFLEAMVNSRYREQYTDAVAVYLNEQTTAGLDICTDGDAHYDEQVGGQSWTSYPLFHMDGFDRKNPKPAVMKTGGVGFPMGHILHDYLEARVMPQIIGPISRGDLQYSQMWKTAQRMTTKPVKFGTVTPELLAAAVDDQYYKDPVERIMALSDAINSELNELADAGCPVIQLEEPQIHMIPTRGPVFGKLGMLAWATIDSAKALKLDRKVGSLKPGKQADIILINKNDLNLFPVNNAVEAVVFHANGSNVDTVIISGKIKKRNGKLAYRGIEKKKILLARSSQRILKDIKN